MFLINFWGDLMLAVPLVAGASSMAYAMILFVVLLVAAVGLVYLVFRE